MSGDNHLHAHIALTNVPTTDMDMDDDEISMSNDTLTNTQTATYTATYIQTECTETIGGNPKHWEWDEVQKWLNQRGLSEFIDVLSEGMTEKEGTDGNELLTITLNKLFDDAGAYKAAMKLNIKDIEEAENSPIIDKFFRELTKLQLQSNESANFTEKEATINDVIEMKRRIKLFVEKWDRIIWIESYEETNGRLPTDIILAEELGVSISVAQVYLHYYENIERQKQKDVDELLLDFNVYNDCVIWWFVIIQIL
eukprot:134752_1